MPNPLDLLWLQLGEVTRLQFTSLSRTGIGWAGEGSGTVTVTQPAAGVLVFTEAGQWRQSGGAALRFSNVYRFTQNGQLVGLEHLRFGPTQPVFLFDMVMSNNGTWSDVEPHACRRDHYSATLELHRENLIFTWRVTGPDRDEEMRYCYW